MEKYSITYNFGRRSRLAVPTGDCDAHIGASCKIDFEGDYTVLKRQTLNTPPCLSAGADMTWQTI